MIQEKETEHAHTLQWRAPPETFLYSTLDSDLILGGGGGGDGNSSWKGEIPVCPPPPPPSVCNLAYVQFPCIPLSLGLTIPSTVGGSQPVGVGGV